MDNGLHACEGAHTAACDKVDSATVKTRIFSGNVDINVKNHEWGFDWEVVHQLGGFLFCRVGQGTARAGAAHGVDILIHVRPVEAEAKAMECPHCIKVAAYRVGMECNKNNVAKRPWDQPQSCV